MRAELVKRCERWSVTTWQAMELRSAATQTGKEAVLVGPDEFKKLAKQSARQRLEDAFLAAWEAFAGTRWPPPEREHKFHPERRWRFDFAWPQIGLAIEIQGGTFVGGRHSRGPAQHSEYDKHNAAVALGWRVLTFDAKHLSKANINDALELVEEAIWATPDVPAEQTGDPQ
jgi:very-short-patch-repair endonuclease